MPVWRALPGRNAVAVFSRGWRTLAANGVVTLRAVQAVCPGRCWNCAWSVRLASGTGRRWLPRSAQIAEYFDGNGRSESTRFVRWRRAADDKICRDARRREVPGRVRTAAHFYQRSRAKAIRTAMSWCLMNRSLLCGPGGRESIVADRRHLSTALGPSLTLPRAGVAFLSLRAWVNG